MQGVQPVPRDELYVPADPEDELSESPKHFLQMDIGLDGLYEAGRAWNEPFAVIQNVEVLFEDRRVCPDHAILRGVPEVASHSYDIRRTGIAPAVAFEYSSQRSGEHDRTEKYRIYEHLGVHEYFGFHIEELSLLGYRLRGGKFRALKPNRERRLQSQELGVELGVYKGFLRMFRAGKLIPAGLEKNQALAEKDAALAERDRQIADLQRRLTMLQPPGES